MLGQLGHQRLLVTRQDLRPRGQFPCSPPLFPPEREPGLLLERRWSQNLHPVLGRDGCHLLNIDGLWTQTLLQRGRSGIQKVLVDASRCPQDQEPGGRLTDDLEAVRDTTRQEDEGAGASFKPLVAAFEEERAV